MKKYNNVKIIIQYSDYALTEKDVEKIVLKYYEENKKRLDNYLKIVYN